MKLDRPNESLFDLEPLFGANDEDADLPDGESEALTQITGSIKWFDATRGFGFVVGDDDEGDVLIHFSVLREHGRRTLPEGTRVECVAVQRERGLQCRRVLTFDLSTATGPDADLVAAKSVERVDPSRLIDQAGDFEAVTVKWFNRLKGYGFHVDEYILRIAAPA
jgi:CspA family cold shock protein